MHRIKIFTGAAHEKVEKDLNEWLSQHDALHVITMTQSENVADDLTGDRGITISILYTL